MEIHPLVPAGSPPAAATRLRRAGLVVDETTRTAEWRNDRIGVAARSRYGQDRRLRLGMRPGELAGVVLATYHVTGRGGGDFRRVLLVDAQGQVLSSSQRLFAADSVHRWPLELFWPLEPLGVDVREESYRTSRAANQAYRGASPMWRFQDYPFAFLMWPVAAFGLLVLIVAGIALSQVL